MITLGKKALSMCSLYIIKIKINNKKNISETVDEFPRGPGFK
jgi:hypothetical protein